MRQKLKLNCGGGDTGSKKCKRSYGGAFGGSRESGGRFFFCVVELVRNLVSVAMEMFFFAFLVYKEIL
jgi:hypothetical protein